MRTCKLIFTTLLASVLLCGCGKQANNIVAQETTKSKVYFIKEINSENILKIYEALGRKAEGNNVAVKVSTGEPGGHHFLDPQLIKAFVQTVNGTIVECNTAYAGGRNTKEDHLKAAEQHGFTAIAKVDIMDGDGEIEIPIKGGKHITSFLCGKNMPSYDFMVVLSHFKGHAMGGFGGAIKNMSIGCASRNGKARVHSAGASDDPNVAWNKLPQQEIWLESMAEGAKAITDYYGDKILYISIANNLSVDCDCDSHPAAPEMVDLGIFASLDPVALDKACTDAVRNSDDKGKAALIKRIDSRKGMHTLDYAEQLGMGSQQYELIELK